MSVQVVSLKVKVGSVEIELTPDQARELLAVLNGWVGEPRVAIWRQGDQNVTYTVGTCLLALSN